MENITKTKLNKFQKSLKISDLNDLARKHIGIKSKAMMTHGIASLEPKIRTEILEKVSTFDDFTDDNDPYKERDFGAFEHKGNSIYWKIDYYAPDMEHGSDDPTDETKTVRLLTIMLSSEY